jgi:predicted permease
VLQDVRYAVRVLFQGKAWSAIVVLSLALGIGANTALFSATNGLLLRQLPVERPQELVRLRHIGRNQMANNISEYGYLPSPEMGSTMSFPLFQELRKANRTLTDMFAGAPLGSLNVIVDGQAEISTAYIATGNYQQLLGLRPLVGRTLLPSDDEAGAPPVATISAPFWARRFGSHPSAIGKVVQVNNTFVTIVGVLPAEFSGVQRVVDTPPDLVLPLVLDTELNPPQSPGPGAAATPRLSQPTYWWLQVGGRLKPGATPEQVEGNLQGVFQQAATAGMSSFLASLPEKERGMSQNRGRTEVSRLSVSAAARGFYDPDPTTLRAVWIISAVVALILLLVCANVANLLLSRAAARQKEISVRLSIGATRVRLVRQLLTESVLLSVAGGALGLVVAYWGRQLLPGTAGQAPLDWRVMLFAAAVALGTGIVFGIAPALRITRGDSAEVLKDTSRTVIASRGLLTKSLLVVQVAISLLLLVGAGLFLRTVNNLRSVDVGFNPHNLVLFRVNPALNGYDQTRMATFYDQLVATLQGIPGVRGVTLSNPALLSGAVNSTNFVVQGTTPPPNANNPINRMRIAPNFFEVMEIPVVRGRRFNERDNLAAPRVALINEAAARRYFPNEDPIGRRFGSSPETSGQTEIVGIVRDVKYSALREPAPPTMYVPYTQGPLGAMVVEVRTVGDPTQVMPHVREAVRRVDSTLPLTDLLTQMDHIERRFAQERVFARAYSLFGGLALLVASIGLFGLMSYNVTRRTTEIGIRMALGAQRQTVLQMVMRESLVLVAVGIAIGVAASIGAGRFVASLLFELSPTDVATITSAVALLLVVSAIAGYVPARRASRLDPMMALRHE